MESKNNRDGCFHLSLKLIIALVSLAGTVLGLLAGWVHCISDRTCLPPTPTVMAIYPTAIPVTIMHTQLPAATEDIMIHIYDAIQGANYADIQAVGSGDMSYYDDYYTGQALRDRQNGINDLNQQGWVVYSQVDTNLSQWYFDKWITSDTVQIQACEYWSSIIYDHSTGEKITSEPQHGVPQVITMERSDGVWRISQLDFDVPNSLCDAA